MEKWKKSIGIQVLKEIGIRSDQYILDFGCGSGVYSIMTSKIVGTNGKIYALDYDENSLKDLTNKIKSKNIKNIEIIKSTREIQVPLQDNSIDVVLIYDSYHLLNKNERNKLLQESYRILKRNGFISYHVTHIGSYDIELKVVKERIKKYGFKSLKEYKKPMFHWAWIEEGLILNYFKI